MVATFLSFEMDMEAVFTELLNPIRDLNKNWEIDIAAYLGKYLEQLEGLNLAFCDGPTKLNFAQAAFLIQRTADVYSKKVEYLYNLVYQMLQLLCTKKNSVDNQNSDQRKNSSLNDSSHEPLQPLDDIVKQKNLQLVEDFHSSVSRKCTLKLLPVVPISLIQVEEVEKEDFMLVGHKGEFSGHKKDFLANVCHLHKTGSLLLHLRDFKELDVISAELPQMQNELENVDDHDINDADNFMDNDVVSLPEDPPELQSNSNERQETNSSNNAILENQPDPPSDPSVPSSLSWKVLDPYAETKAQQAPIRKVRTTRLSNKQTKERTKRKKNSKSVNDNDEPVSEFCSKLCYQIDCKISSNELKVPEIPGLDTVWFKEITKRKENLKKLKLKEKENSLKNSAENGQTNDLSSDSPICNDDSDEDFPSDVDNLPQSPEPDVLNTPRITDIDNGDISVVTTSNDEVSKHIDKYLVNVAQYRKTTDISKRVSEWEERILPCLEQEEKREPYDIHVYSTRILDHFSDNNRKQTLEFSQVCDGKENWEICRYFLASLQLANNYNVDISSDGFLEEGIDTLKLTLLSRKRHHEDLRNFKVS